MKKMEESDKSLLKSLVGGMTKNIIYTFLALSILLYSVVNENVFSFILLSVTLLLILYGIINLAIPTNCYFFKSRNIYNEGKLYKFLIHDIVGKVPLRQYRGRLMIVFYLVYLFTLNLVMCILAIVKSDSSLLYVSNYADLQNILLYVPAVIILVHELLMTIADNIMSSSKPKY